MAGVNMAIEGVDFARDLVRVSALAGIAVYLYKLVRPTHEIDRIAYLSLAVATLGALAALIGALVTEPALVPWAVFSVLPLVLFWVIENEFVTRLFGLCLCLILTGGTILLTPCPAIALSWSSVWLVLTSGLALSVAGLTATAASTLVLALLYHASGVITARRTARFFGFSTATIPDIAYRLIAWSIPFQVCAFGTGAIAFALRELRLWPLLALAGSTALSAGYAVWCRRAGFEPGYRPWLLLVILAVSLGVLRLLGVC